MSRKLLDLWVGIFVAMGLAGVLFLALKVGNLSAGNFAETYPLTAKFANIGGLKVRAPVKSAGVVVGRVADIRSTPRTTKRWSPSTSTRAIVFQEILSP
jgi:phospholipid/cholesterol/gamma-HCH transport system substrate-binding protein